MTHEFDRVIERRGTGSTKWDTFAPDVLPLWVADMDFAAPPAVREAVRRRVDHGIYGYGLVPASLREAICRYQRERHGWAIEPEWLVFLPSLVPGLNCCCRAFAAAGEEVMTITPVYPPFLAAPANQERRLVAVPATLRDGRWELPLRAMEEAVTPQTRVFLFCHPHNPLGRVWRQEEVRALAAFCQCHDLVLCSDEIHADLTLDQLPHLPAAMADERMVSRTVVLCSPSKAYNMPGLKLAYAVIPDEGLRRGFRRAGRGFLEYDYPSWFGPVAAEAAYRHGGDWLAALLDYLRGNRDLVESFVATRLPRVRMTHIEATYLAWLDARAVHLADPAAACLAAGVGLSDGTFFGAPGYLRLNFGCSRAVLEEALRRLEPVLGGEPSGPSVLEVRG